jgi:hypothetical protein
MNARVPSALLIALALALVLMGCGGSGRANSTAAGAASTSSTSTTTGPQPNRSFVASADEICRRMAVNIKGGGFVITRQTMARYGAANGAVELSALRQLSRLTPPASLAADWLRMLADGHQLARELTALGAAAARNEQTAIDAVVSAKKRIHANLRAIAQPRGFKNCAQFG